MAKIDFCIFGVFNLEFLEIREFISSGRIFPIVFSHVTRRVVTPKSNTGERAKVKTKTTWPDYTFGVLGLIARV